MFLATAVTVLCLSVTVNRVRGIASLEEAAKIIHKDIYRVKQTKSELCNQYNCCDISETDSCAITDMKKDEINLVFPGGETRCIFDSSTPYAFEVCLYM